MGSWMASSANTTSSSFMLSALAMSDICGSLFCSFMNLVRTWSALYAVSRRDRLTRRALLSRKWRRTSPIIIGTAYVEKRTPWLKSKLSIDFISPTQPTWKRSSMHSPRLEKRCITLKTRRRFPFMNSSRASVSPCFMRSKSSLLRLALIKGSFDVSTPHISTLHNAISTPLKYS